MNTQRTLAVLIVAGLGATLNVAHADDVCSAAEHQAANAQLARARAAEASGNSAEALRLVKGADFCVDDTAGLRRLALNASYKLGQAAEAAGNLDAAFDYYQGGMVYEQYEDPKPLDLLAHAKRVALAMIEKQPTNRQVARNALEFMNRENQTDGVTKVLQHMDAQARRLLAEEQKAFSIPNAHKELLDEAEDWLAEERLTGVPESSQSTAAELAARWIARGDAFAALDYYTALSQAVSYYEEAGREDKQDAVRNKARQLADGLAGGNRWAEAVRLYELAGDQGKAEALTKQREASAAEVEAERKEKFQQEQDDLEKELGF